MNLRSTEMLKLLMQQKDFSMARLAHYAGCSKSFIGFLANGDKKSCTEDLADEIARALGVPTEILFERRTSAGSGGNVKGTAA